MMDSANGMVIGGVITLSVLCIGIYIWTAIALGAVFAKLGEPAWKAWVPVVNVMTLYTLGGQSALWVIASFVPGANLVALVFMVFALNTINRRFSHGGGFTALALFFPPIWASVVGFGSARPLDEQPEREFVPVFVPAAHPVAWAEQAVSPVDLPVSPAPTGQAGPPAPFSLNAPASTQHAAPASASSPAFSPAPAASTVSPVSTRPVASPWVGSAATSQTAPPAMPLFAGIIPQTEQNRQNPAHDSWGSTSASVQQSAWAPPINSVPGLVLTDIADANTAVDAGPVADAAVSAIVDSDSDSDSDSGAGSEANIPLPIILDDLIDGEFDATVIAGRRRQSWIFETDAGQKVAVTQSQVLLGRNPSSDRDDAEIQFIRVVDPGKTVSKTHARIERVGAVWTITDLHSTNGVILKDQDGLITELDAGTSAEVTEEFILGELPARIYLDRR